MTPSNSAASTARAGIRQRLLRRTALGGALLIMAHAGAAGAMPKLSGVPALVTHAPVITTLNANSTNVALNQSRTIIDWSSFNLAQGQQVDFLFKSNNWIVLNRVLSVAHIDGGVMGCVITCGAGGAIGGNVWFYSPAGVIFGPHAQVNVGGLLATTSPLLSEADFLNGANLDFKFGGGSPDARVVVQSGAQLGALGSLALIAPSVITEAGSSIGAGGTALYGAAQNYVIHFDESAGHGLNLLDFEVPASALSDGTISATPLSLGGDTAAGKVLISSVSQPSVVRAVISLGGVITASSASDAGGGDILLSASGAPVSVEVGGDLRASHGVSMQAPGGGSITVTGAISAGSASGAGGTISLGGAGTGAVDLASGARLDASSTGAGLSGGSVVLTAGAVQVEGAISATGPAGGGTILVGGGAQGRDAGVANASTTDIGSGAVLDASATDNGAGGHVVVWSDQSTTFQGSILSRGGASGGAGGAAEVSSAGYLSYAGAADLRAANGSAGQLLLDPSELTVIPTGGSGTITGGTNVPATSAVSTIGADVIDAALLSADVAISTHMSQTGGDGVIAFNGGGGPLAFANAGTTLRTLTFNSEQGFVFTTGLVTKGPLNLTLFSGAAPINLPSGVSIIVPNGELGLSGANLSLEGVLAAPVVVLSANGSISQIAGAITTGKLLGSSSGSTSLTGANNMIGGLQNFAAGAGLTLSNAADFSAVSVSAGSGSLVLTTTSGSLTINGVTAGTGATLTAATNLNLVGDLTAPTTALSAGGAIDQIGGAITANALSASASNGISLTSANAVASVSGFTNTGSGGVAFADNPGFALSGGINAPGQSVSLVAANGAINQTSGIITANMLTVAALGGVSLTDANLVPILGGLVGSSAGPISFVDADGFTITGDVAASGQTASLVSNGGAITQANGIITAASFSASAASGLSLDGKNAISTVTSLSSGSGGLSFNDHQTVTIAAVTLGGGDLSLSTTRGDLVLTGAVSSPGALTLSSVGAVSLVSASAVGDYSVTGVAISPAALQPTLTGPASNLSIDFTNTIGATNLFSIPIVAPGSVTIVANDASLGIGSVKAGANVTLTSAGSLYEGEGRGVTAPTLAASAVNGLTLDGPNTVSTVTSLTNTQSGPLTFYNRQSVTIGPVIESGEGGIVNLYVQSGDLTMTGAISAPSAVSLNAANNLTVDGVTTPGDVTLTAGGALTETAGGTITLGGNYSADATTMNAAAEQPVFSSGSFGSLSLTFEQSGGTIDLTGTPLSAPQSVSVTANNENLTVDSITAGGDVSLTASGVLAAASNAKINLTNTAGSDNYTLTAVTVAPLTHPAIVQPTFAAGSFGSLNLNFTQSGGTVDLTGAPLSAPGSISVIANSANLTLDALSAGGSVNVSTANALTMVGTTTAAQGVSFFANAAMSVDSISSGSYVELNTGGTLSAASGAVISLFGDYSATAQTIDPTNPTVLQPTFTTGSFGSLNLNFNESGSAINLSGYPLSAPGSVSVAAFNEGLTVDSITAGADINLFASGPLAAAAGSAPVTLTLGGSYSATGTTIDPNLFQPTFTAGSFGNLSLTFNGSGGTADLTGHPLTAPGSVAVTAFSENLTVDSITAGGDITLYSGGNLVGSDATPTLTLGGDYFATGSTIDTRIAQPVFTAGSGGSINLTFNGSGGADLTGQSLIAPGAVFITANNENLTVDSITAGTDVSLSALNGALAAAPNATINLGGNYTANAVTIGSTLLQPIFASGSLGNLSLTFQGFSGVDLTGSPLSALGSISVSAQNENLTVDSITAQNGDVTLFSGLTLAAASGATIALGGNYSATGYTIGAGLLQPTFVTGSNGSLSLTFYESGGTTDLTGHPLTAPFSVSVTAYNENLTVDSITAGQDVSLLSFNGALNTASGATITLGGNYSATAPTISPTLYQPAFTPSSFGSLSLTFTGSGGSVDLTGHPLTAPDGITIASYSEPLTVDAITAGTTVNLTSGGTLSAPATTTANDVFFSSGGDMTVGDVNAVGGVSFTAGGAIIAATVSGVSLGGSYGASGTSIDPRLLQPTFTTGSSGGLSLTFSGSTGPVDLTGHPLTAPGSVAIDVSSEPLTVDSITAGQEVSLTTGGALNEAAGATITAIGLNATANTGITLNGANAVQGVNGLFNSGTGGISFTNTGNLVLNAYVIASGQAVNLVSETGSISEAGYYIDADTLTASAETGITLTSYNLVNNLGPTSNATSGGISFYNSGDLTLVGNISAPGQTVNLIASGALNQTAGAITAGLLTATAQNGIAFNDANLVASLGTLNNASTGGVSFVNQGDLVLVGDLDAIGQTVNLVSNTGAVTDPIGQVFAGTLIGSAVTGFTVNQGSTLTFLGAVSNTGSGGISISNTTDLTLIGDVSAPGQTVNLVSMSGALTQGSGAITAGTLNLSAVTGVDFSDANSAAQLGTIVNATSGDVAFVNDGDFTLTGGITALGQRVSLRANSGAINQVGGIIDAGSLRASAATGLSLTSPNQVTTLGVLENGAYGGIAYTSAGGVNLAVDLNGFGEAVSLTAQSGAVTQSAGEVLTAGTLSLAATTGVNLSNANAVTQLGALNNAAGGVTLNDAVSLSLTGAVQANGQMLGLTGAGSVNQLGGAVTAGTLQVSAVDGISLNTVSATIGLLANSTVGGVSVSTDTGDLQLTANVSAPGQIVSLSSKFGSIGQSGGIITAGVLNASGATGVDLVAANQVNALGLVTNLTSGGVAIVSVGDLNLSQFIDATGQTVSLTSTTGALTQSADLIVASTLNASAATGITLTGGNLVANLGVLSNASLGGISYMSAGDPFLTGNISAPGQAVTLASSTGSFTQQAGVITAGVLNVSAATGITLNDANAVTNLGALSNTTSGGISFAGDPILTGNITAPGQAVNLVSTTGSFTQQAGVITAGVLNVSAVTGITLNDANAVSNLGAIINSGSGGVSFTNAGDFALTGPVQAAGQAVALVSSGGSITQPSGSVNAQDVSVDAAGAVNLTNVIASDQATITASTFSLTAPNDSNGALQAPTLTIESRTGLIDLGDNLNDPGFPGMTITGVTLKALNTDSISFYAGYFSPGNRLTDLAPQAPIGIKVGDISADFKGMNDLPGGATASLFAGPTSTIEVLGAVTSTMPGLGNIIIGDKVADTWTPQTIDISGSIGANGTKLAPLNSVELNATGDVLIGDSQFQQAITNAERAGETEFIDINAGEPPGVTDPGTNAIFIGSNTLTLRAQGVIASQNTGATGTDVGIDLVNANTASTVLVLGSTLATPTKTNPVIIDIFGTVNDATGMAVIGKDLAPSTEISLTAPLAISDFYRANGCVIGETGVCNLLTIATLPVKEIQGVILSTAASSDPAAESAVVARVYAQTILIPMTTITPVGDPTITGVGNEEIWRAPSCDPSGGKTCP